MPEVLVLERREAAGLLFVTRKASLVAGAKAGELPSEIGDVDVGTLAPGYIASVTGDACYVRFAGGLTGRAGLPQVRLLSGVLSFILLLAVSPRLCALASALPSCLASALPSCFAISTVIEYACCGPRRPAARVALPLLSFSVEVELTNGQDDAVCAEYRCAS